VDLPPQADCATTPGVTVDALLAEIKAAMSRKGLTVRVLAEALGKSEQAVGTWLSGKHRPTVENLDAFARVVGLEVALRRVRDE